MAKKKPAPIDHVANLLEQLSNGNIIKRELVIAITRPPHQNLIRRLAITEIVLEQAQLLMSDLAGSLVSERETSGIAVRFFSAAEPVLERGKKVLGGAIKGHEKTHGTAIEKAQRWAEFQKEFDQILQRRPGLNKTSICRLVASKFDVTRETVSRHIKDPREIGTVPATIRNRKP